MFGPKFRIKRQELAGPEALGAVPATAMFSSGGAKNISLYTFLFYSIRTIKFGVKLLVFKFDKFSISFVPSFLLGLKKSFVSDHDY